MNTLIKDILLLVSLGLLVVLAIFYIGKNETLDEKIARYDCRLSEFLPDFPPEVRNECRRRNIENYNQQIKHKD